LEVLFPYDYIYPEQYAYMCKLQSCLLKGHALLEMPTGTGKTVTLLSLVLSFQYAHTECGKLVYCTRTVQEMDKVVEELRHVMAYRKKELAKQQEGAGGDTVRNPNILGVCLSARRNMCIHPVVSQYDNPGKVDSVCRNKTASFVRESKADDPNVDLCEFYEGYNAGASDAGLEGVYSLADMKRLGKEKTWCPYFVARHLVTQADVVVYNYQYMLDPKIAGMVSKEIKKESIVVFDEAHNIDNICIEALSVTLDRRLVQASSRNISRLQEEVKKMEETDRERLNAEYQQLVNGLASNGVLGNAADGMSAAPVLSTDMIQEAVPGNIRKAKHFLMFMRTLTEYIKGKLKGTLPTKEGPKTFVERMQRATRINEVKAFHFAFDRLGSLLTTLKIQNLDEFSPLQVLTTFATLVATYDEGFTVLFEPYDRSPNIPDPRLKLACLDASICIKPVLEKFSTVVITSGTLSPIELYPKLLDFRPAVSESFSMSLTRNCICPLIVTKGSDQVPVTSRFEQRHDSSVITNYGRLMLEIAAVVPDGMVCFFTSYEHLEEVVTRWDDMGILEEVLHHKLIFIETKDIVETTMALQSYKQACDAGRGAIFLSVARGKVAEGVDFDRHYGRCVIMFGIPFQYTLSKVLKERLDFMKKKHDINEGDFLSFDALRQTSQCVGRVIRSKTDYGLMIFADLRYNRADKLKKLPRWITQFIEPEHFNCSTDRAVQACRDFMKKMAQPHNWEDEIGTTMLSETDIKRLQAKTQGERGRGVKRIHDTLGASIIPG